MKNFIIMIAIALGIVTHASAQTLNEQIAVPLSNPGERGILEIGLVNGSIEVSGYDGNEIVVRAVSSESAEEEDGSPRRRNRVSENERAGLTRIPSNAMEIEVSERNNRVTVESNSWKQGIDFVVQVPKNFDLELSTVNGGDIVVEDINGEMELNNVNGEVTAKNIGGSAIIDTVNGKIEASFRSISTDAPMAFTTLNGNVDVTLPSAVKATFRMKSDRGEIYSDFEMDIDQSGPKVDRSNKGGFKVTIENWVYGKVNGGGPEFMFNNMNGNIYIRKAK